MNLHRPDRLDALAKAYALGTLGGGARRRFETLLGRDATARAAVARWQQVLEPFADRIDPLRPRARVWQQLSHRLFTNKRLQPTLLWPIESGSGWGLVRWLAGPLALVLASVATTGVLLRQWPGTLGLEATVPGQHPAYVGLLLDGAGKPALLASARRHGRELTLKFLQPLPTSTGKQAVLWALPEGAPPFAVGTVPLQGNKATLLMSGTAEQLFARVGRLGLSLEPAAATPPALLTLPFIWQGHCVKAW
jgi:anti-sigma-K factor RskA